MHGQNAAQAYMLSPLTPDQFVPQDHPIRQIKLSASLSGHGSG